MIIEMLHKMVKELPVNRKSPEYLKFLKGKYAIKEGFKESYKQGKMS